MEKEYAQFLLDKVNKDYNLIAQDFSRTREVVWPEMDFLFNDFLYPGNKVLDLGCGNGRWFDVFQKMKADYVGVDNSQELIKIAQEKYPQGKFRLANALDLPFSDKFFDCVYSIAVFHQIPSSQFRLKFLEEAKRVLKPGGPLILTVWNFHRPRELILLIKYTILKLLGKSELDFGDVFCSWGDKAKRYYHIFFKRELLNLAKASGWEIKRVGVVKNKKGNRQNIYLILQKPL